MECAFCYEEVNDLSVSVDQHPECTKEVVRRQANGKCIKCNKNPMFESTNWCSSCDYDSKYSGYPGGST